MRKGLLAAAFLTGASIFAFAQEQAFIKTIDNKEHKVFHLTANADGSLEYAEGSNAKIKTKMQKGKYLYAWRSKPKSIKDADELLEKNPEKAKEAYAKAYQKYKLVGWDVYCIYKEAEAAAKLGQKDEAIEKLNTLKNFKLLNLALSNQIDDANKLNANLCIETKKYDAAVSVLDNLLKSKNDDIAAFAYIKKGDIMNRKDDPREAAMFYLQAVLLFPKSKDRAEAIFKTAQMLKIQRDIRSAKFENMLKSEYPDSSYTKQLNK